MKVANRNEAVRRRTATMQKHRKIATSQRLGFHKQQHHAKRIPQLKRRGWTHLENY
eukprot:COSAG01_NODE_23536_length_811_cov_2.043539_1_plen_56_part_00